MRPRTDTRQIDGVTVTLASLDDVIASKTVNARPKDLEALDELREIRRRNEHHPKPPPAPPRRDLVGPNSAPKRPGW